jgi:drug/metabolite transporter (DMT)-like permease
VVSAIYALAFLGEVPDVITIGGGVVILFGIYITTG